jgi:hypothetical protein
LRTPRTAPTLPNEYEYGDDDGDDDDDTDDDDGWLESGVAPALVAAAVWAAPRLLLSSSSIDMSDASHSTSPSNVRFEP